MAKTDDNGTATHVVTQIQYGADVTFTFTKQLEETENEPEETSRLDTCVENFLKILTGSAAGAGGIVAETNWGSEMSIQCHFEDDLQLPKDIKTPKTYAESIEFARNFTQILSDLFCKDPLSGKEPLGVPITVLLHPLGLMHEGVPFTIR